MTRYRPSSSVVCFLRPARACEDRPHGDIVIASVTFEPIDVHGHEYMISDRLQTRGSESSPAKLCCQTQVKHGCVISEVLESHAAEDAQFLMPEPEGLVVITAKGARFNQLLDLGDSPLLWANVERKIVAGEEVDESGTIGTIGIEA